MASSSRHSKSDKGKGKERAPDIPPQAPQISQFNEEEYERHQNQFPTQEIPRETKSPPFTASSRRDGRESFSKDTEADECEDEDDGEVDDSSEDKDEDYEIYKNEAENYSVEKFMVDGNHFSHHHPLTSILDEEADDYGDDKYHSCKICGLPTLSTPSYTCTNTACEFFLHKSCALQFRGKFVHPNHGPLRYEGKTHTLCLREGSPNFTYKCEDCDFEMHPLVAVGGVEIKTKHKSHPSHSLVAVCRETLSMCDACGKKHDGFFFSCGDCNFWIHQCCMYNSKCDFKPKAGGLMFKIERSSGT